MTHYLRFVTLAMCNAFWEISPSAATVGLCFKGFRWDQHTWTET